MKMKKTTSILAIAGVVLALALAAQAAPMVGPTDGYTGPYRIIFSTVDKYDAVSADIATYNARIEAVAAATAGLTYDVSDITGWKMIGSTASVNARVNTGTTATDGLVASGDVPIYNIVGGRVADGNAALWNAASVDLLANIYHVNGNSPGYANRTWTGTLPDGTTHATAPLGAATVGQADNRVLDEGWVAWGGTGNPNPNTSTYLHYGLSPVLRIPGTMIYTK